MTVMQGTDRSFQRLLVLYHYLVMVGSSPATLSVIVFVLRERNP